MKVEPEQGVGDAVPARATAAVAAEPVPVSGRAGIPIAGYTAGPWQAYASVDRERGYLIDTAPLKESTNGYVIADNICGRQAAANARLMAAAPSLVEALEGMIQAELSASGANMARARHKARAALTLALGEQS